VKVDGEEALLGLAAKCRELGITWSIVRDAGRTQVKSSSNSGRGGGTVGPSCQVS
jgi:peptidyl-tRNA hydrolase